MKNEVLLLFSGGKDSFLSACYLIEEGYKLSMVTFENGAGLQAENAKHGAKRIIKRYGKEKAKYLGVHCIAGFWREFFLPYFNMKPSEIVTEYGELTISQFHCLTCRTAMYIWAILKAKQNGIDSIADGARNDQGFAIELPRMINAYKMFLSEYGIDYILPVIDMNSDWKRKNLLLMKGFVPKTLEPQCLMGVPLPEEGIPDTEIQQAVESFFNKVVLTRAKDIIKMQENCILDNNGEI